MSDRNAIIERMNKRDEERIDKLQKSHKAKEEVQSTDEQAEYFGGVFHQKSANILQQLSEVPKLPPHAQQEHFTEVKKDINDLQKYVASSSIFLKEFNMRKYLKMVQDLQTQCYDLEEKHLPRKKFGFKNKPAKSEIHRPDVVKNVDMADGTMPVRVCLGDNFFGFDSKQNEKLFFNCDEIFERDVTLRNLTNCIINLRGVMGTLHMTNLVNCFVVSGPVNSSVFVNNCHDCKLVVICQQMRIHTSKNIELYLHVTSKGIIEDCSGIKTSPYNLHYDGLDQHLEMSTLNFKSNNWDKLEDFNWLSTDSPSPNWSILDESNRIKDWSFIWNNLPLDTMKLFDEN